MYEALHTGMSTESRCNPIVHLSVVLVVLWHNTLQSPMGAMALLLLFLLDTSQTSQDCTLP